MTGRLKDKVAIITGSDSGIGYARDKDGAEQAKRKVEAAGRKAIVVQLDQRDPTQVEKLFRETQAKLGSPYILVNNAGVDSTGKQVADMPIEDWDDELRTNVYGPFYCCQHFIRARRAKGGKGKILNVTSVHEDIPRVGSAGYDCAKGALRNLTRTLALELAPDRINVNNIAPGMVLTPMNQKAIDEPKAREKQVQSIPWKRAAEPEEVAKLALYLASEDADYATGQTYVLDGGLMMNMGQGA